MSHQPSASPESSLVGRRIGVYEVRGLLGRGGMGDVYRAHDTQLRRDVALKLLPPAFAESPDRLARFEREARILASLNHPHIAAIYGLERSASVPALVLELVEGPTLAERIGPRGLPVAEVLGIARQIAEALDAAHEQGIVHRDLKPANIKVTPTGVVKVLDFGLAKTVVEATEQAETTVAQTRDGALVGTVPYMSPEQARGQAVDKRTDIWAFGCVLYEMLTGHAAFRGASVPDILAAVVEREPEWTALPADTPATLRRLLRRCLEKDARQRLRDIGDVAHDLRAEGQAEVAGVGHTGSNSLRRALALAALVGMTALLTLGVRSLVDEPAGGATDASFERNLTPATADDGLAAEPALSDDGVLLAYASDRAGRGDLDIWVQQTAGSVPIRLTHDELDESEPSFSPDGSRIAYRSENDDGGVYVTQTFGGVEPRLLVPGGRRPRFSPDGRLVAYWTGANIGSSTTSGAYRAFVVPSDGGAPKEVSGFTLARFPVWSPDGRFLLVLGSRASPPTPDTLDWWLAPVDGAAPTPLGIATRLREAGIPLQMSTDFGPEAWRGDRVYWSNGFLWTVRVDTAASRLQGVERLTFGTTRDWQATASRGGRVGFASTSESNGIFALPLDAERGAVTGAVRRLTPGAAFYRRPSATRDGRTITYVTGPPQNGVIVRDLQTNLVTDVGVGGSNFGPAISPDGHLIAFERDDAVFVVPAKGGAPRELCRGCGIGDWTSDGTALVVVNGAERGGRLTLVSVDSGAQRDLTSSSAFSLNRPFPSPADRLLAFRVNQSEGVVVAVAPMQSTGPAPESAWIRITPPEQDARPAGWSPSGRLLYFVSGRDGTRCLYAQRLDGDSGRPIGQAFVVQHFHGTRNLSTGAGGVLSTGPGNAVRGGLFFYDHAERRSNIWLLSPPSTSLEP